MKKLLIVIVGMLASLSATAQLIPESGFALTYRDSIKEIRKFINECGTRGSVMVYWLEWDHEVKDKKVEKIKAEFNRLLKAYPEKEAVLKFFYGRFQLIAKSDLVDKKEGLRFLQEYGDAVCQHKKQTGLIKENAMNKDDWYALQGLAYLKGKGIEHDEALAFAFFKKAAEGSKTYKNLINDFYLLGIGTPIDDGKVFEERLPDYSKNRGGNAIVTVGNYSENYQKAYALKFYSALSADSLLMEDYRKGQRKMLIDDDYEGAKSILKMNAEKGHLPSMYELAMLYEKNHKEENWKDMRELWLEKAASKGYLPADFKIEHLIFSSSDNKMFAPQQRVLEAEAYQGFVRLAKKGYAPAIDMLEMYDRYQYAKVSEGTGREWVKVAKEMTKKNAETPKDTLPKSVVESLWKQQIKMAPYGADSLKSIEKQYQILEQITSHWINIYEKANTYLKSQHDSNSETKIQTLNNKVLADVAKTELKDKLTRLQAQRNLLAKTIQDVVAKGAIEIKAEEYLASPGHTGIR